MEMEWTHFSRLGPGQVQLQLQYSVRIITVRSTAQQ